MQMVKVAGHRASAAQEDLHDSSQSRFDDEATAYAASFIAQEDDLRFVIGVSDYPTVKALVYTIEAAKMLCAGAPGIERARRLLDMARKEAGSNGEGKEPLDDPARGYLVFQTR